MQEDGLDSALQFSMALRHNFEGHLRKLWMSGVFFNHKNTLKAYYKQGICYILMLLQIVAMKLHTCCILIGNRQNPEYSTAG